MVTTSTRTEARLLMGVLVLGLVGIVLTGCAGASTRSTSETTAATAATFTGPDQQSARSSVPVEPIMPKAGS